MNNEQNKYVAQTLYHDITKYIFYNNEDERIKSLINSFEISLENNDFENFIKEHLYIIYKIYFEKNYLEKELINKNSFYESYQLISRIGNRYFETTSHTDNHNRISYLSEVFPKIKTVKGIVYKYK